MLKYVWIECLVVFNHSEFAARTSLVKRGKELRQNVNYLTASATESDLLYLAVPFHCGLYRNLEQASQPKKALFVIDLLSNLPDPVLDNQGA